MGKVLTLEAVLLLYITTSGRVHSGKHDRGSGLLLSHSISISACISRPVSAESQTNATDECLQLFLMPFPPTARGVKFTVQGHTEVSCS